MSTSAFRYKFADTQTFSDAIESLQLAILAAEGLFGAPSVHLCTNPIVTDADYTVLIGDVTNEEHAVNRLFMQFLLREFGGKAFVVDRVRVATPRGTAERN